MHRGVFHRKLLPYESWKLAINLVAIHSIIISSLQIDDRTENRRKKYLGTVNLQSPHTLSKDQFEKAMASSNCDDSVRRYFARERPL